MPRRAPRYCTASGCNEWATPHGRCTKHLIPKPRPRQQTSRPTRQELGYDEDWLRLSAQVRRERPWCEHCGKRRSRHVDHIDGNRANRSRSNLAALCISCHSRKTGKVDGGFGNARRTLNTAG